MSHGDIPRAGRRHLLTRDLNCCTHAAGRRRGGCHPPGALPLWALGAAGERQHEERSGGCERKPGELKRELISHKLVAARGINAGKRLPSATGRERGTSSDFRSARSCASHHPSSKMEPALALLYPSTFGGKIPEHASGSLGSTAVSWIHHSLLMPNPGSARRQRVFSNASSWIGTYLGSSEQTSSVPGS